MSSLTHSLSLEEAVSIGNRPSIPFLENEPEGGIIGKWVGNRLVLQIPIEEAKSHKVIRRIVQLVALGVSCAGPYSYANMSRQVSDGSLGDILVSGSWVSFGALNIWSWQAIIESEMGPRSEEEKALDEKTSCCKVATKICAFLLGASSQIPLAYLAAVYNPSHPGLCIFITLAAETGPTLKSINSTLDEIRIRRSLTPEEKELQRLKDELSAIISDNRFALIELGQGERTEYLQRLLSIKDLDVPDLDKVKQYATLLLTPVKPRVRDVETLPARGLRYAATAAGAVLSVARLAMFAVTTFQATKLITHDDVACTISAGVVTASNAYLSIDVLNKVANVTAKRLFGSCCTRVKPNLAYQLRPKLTTALKLLAMGFVSMSWGPLVEVGQAYFSGDLSTTMKITLSMGAVMLVANAMDSLVDDLILAGVNRWGIEEERLFLRVSQQMKQFIEILNRSPMLEFAKFAKILPENVLSEVFADLNMTSEKLDRYIDSKMDRPRLVELEDRQELEVPLLALRDSAS